LEESTFKAHQKSKQKCSNTGDSTCCTLALVWKKKAMSKAKTLEVTCPSLQKNKSNKAAGKFNVTQPGVAGFNKVGSNTGMAETAWGSILI